MEHPKSELLRLQREQRKSRQDEVFGGFSKAEQAEYNERDERIHALESEIQASSLAETSLQSAQAEQRRQWGKESETDTPQTAAHQPYRNREKGSTYSTDSRRKPRKGKNAPEEESSE